MRFVQATALICSILLPKLRANDTMVTLGAGGLIPVKSTAIRLISEDLQISTRQIKVKYTFHNTTDQDVNATVAFPLPDLDGDELRVYPFALPNHDPGNFVNFEVWVEGNRVKANLESRAFFDGRDITDQIHSIGLPISVVDPAFDTAIAKAPLAKVRQLEKEGLIMYDRPGQNGCGTQKYKCWPVWTTKASFYWTQRFPANRSVTVSHTYTPVAGGGRRFGWEEGANSIHDYCPDLAARRHIDRLKTLYPAKGKLIPVLLESQVRYVLSTAKNWNGPIQRFHLSVLVDDPDEIVLTCMLGLRKTAPTRYELLRSSFVPDSELELLFITPEK